MGMNQEGIWYLFLYVETLWDYYSQLAGGPPNRIKTQELVCVGEGGKR